MMRGERVDLIVRLAIAHALDREPGIGVVVLEGEAFTVVDGSFGDGFFKHNPAFNAIF